MQATQTQVMPSRMTLQQARCVVWPFNKNRGLAGRRIGDLLDAGLLSKHDLQWASTHAHNSGIQAACSAILSTSLKAGLSTSLDAGLNQHPAAGRHVIRDADPNLKLPDQPPSEARPIRWQDLISQACEPETRQRNVPSPAPIPDTCPICGSAVRPNHPWDTVRRLGWRCEQGGTAHYLEAGWERVKSWFFREYHPPVR